MNYYANNGSEIKSQRNDVIEKLNSELKAKNSLIQSMQMKQYSFNQNVNSEKKTIKFAEEKQEISEAEPYEEEAKSQKRFARRKTESSVNISNNMVFTPVKSKIKKKLSNNFSKINTFSTEFKKDKYKFLFDNPKSINDLILMDTSSKKYSQVMDHTLSLRQSELDLLTMTTQCFSKMINYTNNLECLKYIVSKICAYLSYQKCYIMQIDIGNSKLKQVSDPSCMDINFNEKTAQMLFKSCIEDRVIMDFDTESTAQFETIVNKYFQFKPRDLLIVPILDKDKRNSKGVMLLANSIQAPEIEHFSDTWNILLIIDLKYIYFEISYRQMLIEATKEKRNKINMAYSDMLNCHRTCLLTEYVESKLRDLFDVHRINFLLCDHRRNELYKIVSDGKTHQQTIISYDNEKGLAKVVANDGIANIANNAQCSKKFFALILKSTRID